MVSFTTFIAAGSAILAATTASAAPSADQFNAVKRDDTLCGVQPVPGIRKPVEGSTITFTAEQQKNYEGATIEIAYCSGDYFKTASLNATVLLGDDASSGMVLGSAVPTPGAAPAGFYGYVFNVSVYPISGNYITGSKKLSVFEWETGYYNAHNFKVHTVTVNFEKEPTN